MNDENYKFQKEKIKQQKTLSEEENYLKNTKILHEKLSKKPFLFKLAKVGYQNYISTVGRFHILPDFLICGFPQCGTTSLYGGLTKHPQILGAKTKEIYFFDENFHRGENWYRYRFPSKLRKFIERKKIITGEATPSYPYHPHTLQRIAQVIPQVKLIVILRNPMDRAYALHSKAVRQGKENLSFEDAIEKEEKNSEGEMEILKNNSEEYSETYYWKAYLDKGKYYNHLSKWMEVFPREQFFVIRSEDFFEKPSKIFNDLYKFLGIPEFNYENYPYYNAGKYSPMKPETRKKLIEYYKPYNENLYKLIGKNFDWDK